MLRRPQKACSLPLGRPTPAVTRARSSEAPGVNDHSHESIPRWHASPGAHGRLRTWFGVAQGLRQGFFLSPLLFSILFEAPIEIVLVRFSKDDVRHPQRSGTLQGGDWGDYEGNSSTVVTSMEGDLGHVGRR